MLNATDVSPALSADAVAGLAGWRRWALPSLSDCMLTALALWLLASTLMWSGSGLLSDASAGVHVRTGEWILDNGRVPDRDLFSFSRPGEPWFAWEWLSDVGMALVYRTGGLPAILLVAVAVICLTFLISMRHMISQGANALAVVLVAHAGIAVSSVHFLARPHLATLVLVAVSWWLLDSDRRQATRWVWLLVPLTAIWANLHAGFTAILATLAALAIGTLIESLLDPAKQATRRKQALRYGTLLAGCLAASLANPYGLDLHRHLLQFLRADWVREIVLEHQAPKFNSSAGLYYEVVLFAGVAVVFWLMRKREVAPALVIMGWMHASLQSVRHFPILYLVLAPALGAAIMELWRAAIARFGRRGLFGDLHRLGDDYATSLARNSVAVLLVPALLVGGVGIGRVVPPDFPADRYPVDVVTEQASLLAAGRPFAPDYWADYLIYRNYPSQRAFIDGRTDFYGETMSEEYVTLLNALPGWEEIVERYKINLILVPPQAALAAAVRLLPDWRTIVSEPGVVLYQRATPESGLESTIRPGTATAQPGQSEVPVAAAGTG